MTANPTLLHATLRAGPRDRARWYWLPPPTLDVALGTYVWAGFQVAYVRGRTGAVAIYCLHGNGTL
jgi:hypothetical protein